MEDTANFDVFTNKFSHDVYKQKYSLNSQECWSDTCKRVVSSVCGQLLAKEDQEAIFKLLCERKFIPGGRYLALAGQPYHAINNCYLFKARDMREDWGDLLNRTSLSLMSGGGIGVDYSKLREEGALIKKTGGKSSGPIGLMSMVNEVARYVMRGGNGRGAVWAGLDWNHPDIFKFMDLKNHSEQMKLLKSHDFMFPLPMEQTNISVIYDTEFFVAVEDMNHPKHIDAMKIWMMNCLQAFSTAEPGMSFNFLKDNESGRNACAEVTTEDDSDKCNLGTIWLNRIKSKKDFTTTIKYAVKFLMCGGIYSDVPTEKIREVGTKNNRIGLGLGGMHEWLMKNGQDYEVTPELHKYLSVYKQESDSAAYLTAKELGVNIPKGVRAIAPTGTLALLAETTSGIEPLLCSAYKRRYLKEKDTWAYQYVIDGAVKRLLASGVKLEQIKDAYDIPFKQRVKFQADVQNYVDMAISSTCNLSRWGSEDNNKNNVQEKADILLYYAKRLRGFTCYPDGCREGQPIEKVSLSEALENEGKVFEEKENPCSSGVCGV